MENIFMESWYDRSWYVALFWNIYRMSFIKRKYRFSQSTTKTNQELVKFMQVAWFIEFNSCLTLH